MYYLNSFRKSTRPLNRYGRVESSGFRVSVVGFRVRVSGLGIGVEPAGMVLERIRVSGLGLGAWGVGLSLQPLPWRGGLGASLCVSLIREIRNWKVKRFTATLNCELRILAAHRLQP